MGAPRLSSQPFGFGLWLYFLVSVQTLNLQGELKICWTIVCAVSGSNTKLCDSTKPVRDLLPERSLTNVSIALDRRHLPYTNDAIRYDCS